MLRTPRIIALLVAVAVGVLLGIGFLLTGVDRVSPVGDQFSRIDEYVQAEIGASNIPGVALAIVEGGEVVHARGFGTTATATQ